MSDKVSTNTTHSSATTNTTTHTEPTNILLPSISSVNNSLNLSTISLMNIPAPSDCSFSTSIFNLSTNDTTTNAFVDIGQNLLCCDTSSPLPVENQSFTTLQPCSTESPLPVENQSFTTLQSCPTEYPIEEPYRSEYPTSNTQENMDLSKSCTRFSDFVSKCSF